MSPASAPVPASNPPPGLLTLDVGFDVDAFAQQLGETALRVTVPRENLLEVLTRVSDFMGFGIYVYTVSVRPLPGESLKSFEVELHRVDYSPAQRAWLPFQERGRSSTPFGPDTSRPAEP